ncbi:hypothetical protein [Streptomyces sp. NPDC002403]
MTPPSRTSAGATARPSGVPGADPSTADPATPSAEPSSIPTAVPPGGGSAAPAPPGPPHPSAPGSGSPADSAPASPAPSPSRTPLSDSSSDPFSDSSSGSDEEPPGTEVQPPLAGREAGEGRLRPGRQLSPWEFAHVDSSLPQPDAPPAPTDPDPAPAATPEANTAPGADRLSQQALDTTTVQRVKRVSLGAGIALIGLGLGFLAFRMRRTD